MAAKFLNNVRVLVKEGCEDDYLKAVETWTTPDGMSDRYLAKTGERRYCFVGLWESEEKLIKTEIPKTCIIHIHIGKITVNGVSEILNSKFLKTSICYKLKKD